MKTCSVLIAPVLCCGTSFFGAAASSGADTPAAIAPADVEFFEAKIRPVLVEHCYACHSADAKKLQGGLLLDNRAGVAAGGESGPVVVPGKPDESVLISAMRHESYEMPPDTRLAEAIIRDFEEWIRRGAPDPREGEAVKKVRVLYDEAEAARHWAFQPVAKPPVPESVDPWVRTPIDAFILAKLKAAGLTPSPPADRRTLLRRASYDLLGLPPSYAEVRAFEPATAADAWDREVDRLLASPHYGERWARHWLDLARYADNNGERLAPTKGAPYYPFAWVYRDYVIDALNRDLPYDDFVREQIAGDLLNGGNDKHKAAATGFFRVGKAFGQNLNNRTDDRIDALSKTFLGLTVACARCHDHKFDPIPTADYYALHGVLTSSEDADVLLHDTAGTPEHAAYVAHAQKLVDDVRNDVQQRLNAYCSKVTQQTSEYLLGAQAFRDGKLKAQDPLQASREVDLPPNLFAAWVDTLERLQKSDHPAMRPWFEFAALDVDRFSRLGPALAQQIAAGKLDKSVHPLVAKAFAEQRPQSLAEVAAIYQSLFLEVERRAGSRYPLAELLLGEKVETKISRQDRTRSELPPPLDDPDWESLRQIVVGFDGPFGMSPRSLTNSGAGDLRRPLVMIRHEAVRLEGEHPGAPVKAMTLRDAAEPKNSHILIRGDAGNPGAEAPRRFLSALRRVSSEPFTDGSGRRELAEAIASPRNPLTARVIVNRVWRWHFGQGLVSTPSDFGLRGSPPSHPELLDWLATWFVEHDWSIKQLNRLIMTSAVYRQAGVHRGECAEIDPQNILFWRFPPRRLQFEELRDTLLAAAGRLQPAVGGRPVDADGDASRRTLYLYVDRYELPDLFRTFDFADPEFTTGERESTIVPQQALYFMNQSWIMARADDLAGRVAETAGDDAVEAVRAMYRMVFSRDPAADELELAAAYVKPSPTGPLRLQRLAHALLQTNELMHVE